MKKRSLEDIYLTKKIIQLNKRALAQEHIVNLDAYRSVSHSNSTKTVLIVDEDPIALNSLKRIFENEKYRVFIAKDAMEVSQIIEDTYLDIILLEVQLPWISGYELCSLLKSTPYLKNLPVALISGNKTDEDIRKGFESGCDEFITKPLDVNHLQQTVERLLS